MSEAFVSRWDKRPIAERRAFTYYPSEGRWRERTAEIYQDPQP